MGPARRYSESQVDEMISAYLGGKTLTQAAAIHGISTPCLRSRMDERGITRRTHTDDGWRPPRVDQNRFAHIDTEEAAYYLGLLFTDGCLTPRGVSLSLQARDGDLVRRFARWLGWTGEPRTYPRKGRVCRGQLVKGGWTTEMTVANRRLRNNLVKAGMHQRKTWTIRPWDGPDHLLRHFWRGAVDGDGCLTHDAHGRWSIGLAGNEHMIAGFSAFIARRVGSPGSIILSDPEGKEARGAGLLSANVSWCGNGVCQEIARLLYDDVSVALDRKLARARRIMSAPIHRARHRCRVLSREDVRRACDQSDRLLDAARQLGISFNSLWRLRKRFGLSG